MGDKKLEGQPLGLSLTCCVIWGNLFKLSEVLFPHL